MATQASEVERRVAPQNLSLAAQKAAHLSVERDPGLHRFVTQEIEWLMGLRAKRPTPPTGTSRLTTGMLRRQAVACLAMTGMAKVASPGWPG